MYGSSDDLAATLSRARNPGARRVPPPRFAAVGWAIGFTVVASGLALLPFRTFDAFRQSLILLHVAAGIAFIPVFAVFLQRHLSTRSGHRHAGLAFLGLLLWLIVQALWLHDLAALRIPINVAPWVLFFLLVERAYWKATFLGIGALLALDVVLGIAARVGPVPIYIMAMYLPAFVLLNVAYHFRRGSIPVVDPAQRRTWLSGVLFAIAMTLVVFYGLLLLEGSGAAICGWMVGPIHGWGTFVLLALAWRHGTLVDRLNRSRTGRAPVRSALRSYRLAGAAALATTLLVPAVVAWTGFGMPSGWRDRARRGPESLPAPTRWATSDGRPLDSTSLGSSERCGTCHLDVFRTWSQSAHARATQSRLFQELLLRAKADLGDDRAEVYCLSCHAPPAVLLGSNPGAAERAAAVAGGISCGSCHQVESAAKPVGDAAFVFDVRPPFLFEGSGSYDLLVRTLYRIGADEHLSRFRRPVVGSEDLCAGCHVATSAPLAKSEPPLTVLDVVHSWKASDWGPSGSRSTPCKGCHMPYLVLSQVSRYQRDHRFFSAGWSRYGRTAEPSSLGYVDLWLKGDRSAIEEASQREFLDGFRARFPDMPPDEARSQALDLYHEKRGSRFSDFSTFPDEERFPGGAPFAIDPRLQCDGAACRLTIEVSNRTVPHRFPAGEPSGVDLWLQVDVRDCEGRSQFRSGVPETDGTVPSEAVRFGARGLDDRGSLVPERRSWRYRSWAAERFLEPGKPSVAELSFAASPPHGSCTLRAQVDLAYRSTSAALSHDLLGPDVPLPPVIVLASAVTQATP